MLNEMSWQSVVRVFGLATTSGFAGFETSTIAGPAFGPPERPPPAV
jgi:hypothetical protein